MDTSFFTNKRVVVMGLGILGGGVGTVKYILSKGADVVVTDLRSEEILQSSLRKLKGLPVRYVLGRHDATDIKNADLIIKNPSVPSDSSFLATARKKNIAIEMAESLFMKLSPTTNIIGVTGTRGKSTTSALIHRILRDAGYDTYLSGNVVGESTLMLLDKLTKRSVVVLELSSWQLESFGWHRISPHTAVITNIYPDHLNRYPSMNAYISDKKNIYRYQQPDDLLVLNGDDRESKQFATDAASRVVYFSANDIPETLTLKIPGAHNRANAAACLKVGTLFGVHSDVIMKTLSSFGGLAYRLETIAHVDGVTVINDTTSTTPTATIAAIESYPSKRIILIAGGNDKNLPIELLVNAIVAHCKAVILIRGAGTDRLRQALKANNAHSLRESITQAFAKAVSGDVILFSPGFTSFAQFKNEFDRGEQFTHEVQTFLSSRNKN